MVLWSKPSCRLVNGMYLERLGTIPHYRVRGTSATFAWRVNARRISAGDGVRQPMELVLGDRATFAVDGAAPPRRGNGARRGRSLDRRGNLPHVRAGKDLEVRLALAPGSEGVAGHLRRRSGCRRVATTPAEPRATPLLSPTETLVVAIEGHLNGSSFKSRFPDTGQDVRGLRVSAYGDTVDVTGRHADASEPAHAVRGCVLPAQGRSRSFRTWRPGSPASPSPFGVASQRAGAPPWTRCRGRLPERDGHLRRGRGGLGARSAREPRTTASIAFARPTGGEAAAGKNAVADAGKIYSVFS